MRNKLLLLGIIIFVISCFLFLYFTFYKVSTYNLVCDEKCTSSVDVSYSATLDDVSNTLKVIKKGNGSFEPYISFSLDDSNYLDDYNSKYNKKSSGTIKLTDSEVKNIKKLLKLNNKVNNKYDVDIIIIMLDLINNNDNYCKSDVNCFKYYKNADKDSNKTITYREKANYLFAKYEKYIKENDNVSKNSKKLSLSEFNCKYDKNSCTKEFKLKYNEFDHLIKLKYYYTVEYEKGNAVASMYYDYFVNDKKIDKIKDADYYLLENDTPINNPKYSIIYKSGLKDMLNFGGYLLVIDNKYLAFVRETFINTDYTSFTMNIYNKSQEKDIVLPRVISLDDITIKKDKLYIWYPYCNDKKMVSLEFKVSDNNLEVIPSKERKMTSIENSMDKDDFGVCYNKDNSKIISY